MISQPMKGRSDEEINKTRNIAIDYAEQHNYRFINTLFTDEWYSDEYTKAREVVNIPLYFLAKSLANMSKCDAAYFAKGWETTRGCVLEHEVAKAYNVEIIYE